MTQQIVWLAAYPRSGVTFLRLMLERMYRLPTYTLYKDEWRTTGRLFTGGRIYPHDLNGQPVVFVKTHDLPPPHMDKAIHLVRDPRDTLVSHAHYMCDVLSHRAAPWEMLEEILRKGTIHPRWGRHTTAWLNTPAVRIHFNDLVTEPHKTIRGVVSSLGLDVLCVHADENVEFADLHSEYPKMFRSGQTGQWKTEFPLRLLDLFEQLDGDAIQAYDRAFGQNVYGQRS